MNEIFAEEAPPTVDALPDNHPGVEDGVVENGEKIVYEYDEDDVLVGWHKEVVE